MWRDFESRSKNNVGCQTSVPRYARVSSVCSALRNGGICEHNLLTRSLNSMDASGDRKVTWGSATQNWGPEPNWHVHISHGHLCSPKNIFSQRHGVPRTLCGCSVCVKAQAWVLCDWVERLVVERKEERASLRLHAEESRYGVATISRLLKIIGLFCKRDLLKRRHSAKEMYNFMEPTNRSHPILQILRQLLSQWYIAVHTNNFENVYIWI